MDDEQNLESLDSNLMFPDGTVLMINNSRGELPSGRDHANHQLLNCLQRINPEFTANLNTESIRTILLLTVHADNLVKAMTMSKDGGTRRGFRKIAVSRVSNILIEIAQGSTLGPASIPIKVSATILTDRHQQDVRLGEVFEFRTDRDALEISERYNFYHERFGDKNPLSGSIWSMSSGASRHSTGYAASWSES